MTRQHDDLRTADRSGPGDAGEEDASAELGPVLPVQRDEFTCTGCFLVLHRSRLADPAAGRCRDCA